MEASTFAALALACSPQVHLTTAHALVGLVVWFALDGTRRYGTISKALFLLPTPLLAALLVHGVVAAPRYITTLLALDELWRAAGTVGAMVLCLWGAHIVALAFVRSAPPAAGE